MTALEVRVDQVAHDAAEARRLAAAADRNVSEVQTTLQANTRVLNALRETQLEHGQRLGAVEGRLDSVEHRLDSLEHKVDQGFGMVATGMAQIVALIKGMEQRLDQA